MIISSSIYFHENRIFNSSLYLYEKYIVQICCKIFIWSSAEEHLVFLHILSIVKSPTVKQLFLMISTGCLVNFVWAHSQELDIFRSFWSFLMDSNSIGINLHPYQMRVGVLFLPHPYKDLLLFLTRLSIWFRQHMIKR